MGCSSMDICILTFDSHLCTLQTENSSLSWKIQADYKFYHKSCNLNFNLIASLFYFLKLVTENIEVLYLFKSLINTQK